MEINCKYCPKNDGTGNCLINGCPLPPVIKEIEEMQSFLEITASDNPKELIDRLTDINSISHALASCLLTPRHIRIR